MPSVKRMGEKLFGTSYTTQTAVESQPELLSTIRVPKNLLYLTDRLPKPSYHSEKYQRKQAQTTSIIKHTDSTILLNDG